MKRFKVTAEPIPCKFAPGDRVKPTAEAISLGWIKSGRVIGCGTHTILVCIDGEERSANYSLDYWEPE